MWQGFDAEQQRKSTQFGLELCPEGTVQLSQRSTTRYRPGRADLRRWPRRRTATSDACCQSAAILWSVHQGPTGSRPEAAHQLNETKCRGSEGKAEEGKERTSRSAICLQDRRGHPLQQWPVSRHFRCDASCSTVPDLWSAKEGPPPRGLPIGKNVILVLWLLFLYWTGMSWWTSLLDVMTSKMCMICTVLSFFNKLILLKLYQCFVVYDLPVNWIISMFHIIMISTKRRRNGEHSK